MKLHKLFLVSAGLAAASSVFAATDIKSGTGTDLTLGTSWGSGVAPTSADVATWDTTSLGAGLTAGSNVSWGSINITGALSNIGITGAGIITTGNITLAGAQTLSIANAIALSGNATYDIADVTGNANADATLSGVVTGTGFGITKTGAGTLVLSGTGKTYTGATNITAGTLRLSETGTTFVSAINVAGGATLDLNTANATWDTVMFDTAAGAITGTGTITKTGTGIFQYRNTTTFKDFAGTIDIQAGTFGSAFTTGTLGKDGSLMTVNVGASGLFDLRTSGANAAKIDKLTGTGRVGTTHNAGGGSTLTVGTAGGSSRFDGVIMGDGSSGQNDTTNPNNSTVALVKVGGGTFTLTNANTYTGGTTVNGGTLKLDFSATGATATNILRSTGALTLGGGNLTLVGKASTTNSQTVAGLTLTAGTASSITLNADATANPLLLTLGAITRNAGATINFTLPTGAQSATNGVTTTSTNTNGILGPWAFVGSGAGASYATVSGGNIVAYASATAATDASGFTDTTGSVNYDLATASGTTPATVSANTIRYTGAAGTTAPGATSFSVNGLMNTGTGLWTIGTNTLTIGSAKDLVVNTANADIAITGIVANNGGGASALTKLGAGTLTLSNANSYSGGTFVNEGTLKLDLTSRAGQISIGSFSVGAAGTLELFSSMSTTAMESLLFNGAAAATVNGSGTINKTGAGALEFFNGAGLNFNGTINIQAGLLATNGSTWSNTATTALNMSGGTFLDIRTGSIGVSTLTGSGSIGISHTAGASLTVGNNNASSQFDGTLRNVISGYAGTGYGTGSALNLIKTGNGTLTLTGANDYTGATTVNGGVLKAGSSKGVFGNNSAVTLANAAGVTLDLNGFNVSIGSLAGGGATGGAVTLGAGTLTTGGNNTSTSFAGIISGTGNLIKVGTGTQTLSGANTYTGVTSVAAGTLLLDFSATGAPASNILASSSALALSGGTLGIKGATSATNSQVFNGVSGSGILSLAPNGATSLNATLGALSGTAASIDFVGANTTVSGGTATAGSANFITTTTTTGNNGTGRLGWSLWKGTDWASTASDGTNTYVVAWQGTYTGLTSNGGATNSTGDLKIATGGTAVGTATTYSANTSINSLLMTATDFATTVGLNAGVTLTLDTDVNGTGAAVIGGTGKSLSIGNVVGQGTLTAGTTAGSTLVLNNLNSASTLTVNSVIADNAAGAGSVSLSTAGAVTLAAANTFKGAVTITGGTLQLGNVNALTANNDVTLAAGSSNATLYFQANGNHVIKTLTVGANATGATILSAAWAPAVNGITTLNSALTEKGVNTGAWNGVQFNGKITGNGAGAGNDSLILDANGQTNTANAFVWQYNGTVANDFVGNVRVKGGVTNAQALGNNADLNVLIPDAAMLTIDTGSTLRWNNTNNGSGARNIIETFDGLAGGGVFDRAGAGASSVLTINANNAANDGKRVFSGSLVAWSGLTFNGTGTQEFVGTNLNYTNATNLNNGTLKLTNTTAWGSNIVIGSSNSPKLQLNYSGASNFGNVISGGSANATVEKIGAGNLTLTALNTYTGNTVVTQGTLTVGNGGQIVLSAANGVSIASGATLALSGTGILKMSSAAATIVNSGTFAAGGTLNLNSLFDNFNGGAGGTYTLVTGTGANSGVFATINGYNSSVWNSVTFNNATGQLVFTAVPEPSTYGLIGAGALAAVAFARRRRRHAGKVVA